MIHESELLDVVRGYIVCAIWADMHPHCDCGDSCNCETGSDAHSLSDVRVGDWAGLSSLIRGWVNANYDDYFAYTMERPADHFGHDLRLTAGGHGAGFWDRGMGDLGERLTVAAHEFPDIECWENADGEVCFDLLPSYFKEGSNESV